MKRILFEKYLQGFTEGLYAVKLKYKYDFQSVYDVSIEVFYIDDHKIIWFNDWDEGQQDIEIELCVNIEKLFTCLKKG